MDRMAQPYHSFRTGSQLPNSFLNFSRLGQVIIAGQVERRTERDTYATDAGHLPGLVQHTVETVDPNRDDG
jgi:hypothetical protein